MGKKVADDETNNHEADSEHEQDEDEKFIQVEDRLGNFKQAVSIHDKYKGRPKLPDGKEWDIIFAQFATCYQQYPGSKAPKNVIWQGSMSEKHGQTIRNYFNNEMLPKYIKVTLSPQKHVFMYLRRFPRIMRMHASVKKDGYEQFYSDMQLFFPWREENKDLYPHDETKCIEKFHNVKDSIFKMKEYLC